MRIVLVCMPWQALEFPSLAIGILHERARRCRQPHEVKGLYAHLRWAEYLLERSGGRVTSKEYTAIANNGIFHGIGDWIFSPALYGVPEWNVEGYTQYLRRAGFDPSLATELHRWTPDFIEKLADEVLAMEPDLVGFTSTFMQNVPSLALARVLKQRRPQVLTAMGGANCDGPQGPALHRNHPFLDFVVRGEGEQTFVELLDALAGHGRLEAIPGLCWRDGNTVSRVNPERQGAFPMHDVPAPNYDDYFEQVARSPVNGFIHPLLVLEGARGCWWGEKHHCTFCGLNGSLMKFRAKPPELLWEEMRRAIERYQTLDIVMVDNIIDMKYFKGLLPHVAAAGWDLRIHYEVKSNLTREQIQTLKAAGVVHVQPGIENLSSRVLKLMRKGVSGSQNVQVLRDCEEHGLTVAWNFLYGFPGEEPRDYAGIIEQMPAMVHLQPPTGALRIALERFSPNFADPSLGFGDHRPAAFYPFVYPLPEHELMDLAYLFDTAPLGLTGEVAAQLERAVARWKQVHGDSELSYRESRGRIHLKDRREGWPEQDTVLASPVEVALFHALQRPMSPAGLTERLQQAGLPVTGEDVSARLSAWKARGWVFEEGERFVALPTGANPRNVRIPLSQRQEVQSP